MNSIRKYLSIQSIRHSILNKYHRYDLSRANFYSIIKNKRVLNIPTSIIKNRINSSSFSSNTLSKRYYNSNRNRYDSKFLYFLQDNIIFIIIAINSLIYLYWQQMSSIKRLKWMQNHFMISSYGLFYQGYIHTLLTSTFSHNSLSHLVMNMFTLYFFGSQALLALGLSKFLSLYLLGGIGGSLCYASFPYLMMKYQEYSRKRSPLGYRYQYQLDRPLYSRALGASGAISAIVAWTIINNPTGMVYLYFVIPIPTALFGVGFICYDVYNVYQGYYNQTGSGGTAHIGGALVGAMFALRRFRRRF